MTGLKPWFDARSLREKRLLVVMVVLLAVTLVWAGIVRPVGDALSSTEERHAAAVVRLGEAEAAVAAIRAGGRPAPLGASLADTVRARADQAGFPLGDLSEDGPDRVRVRVPTARPGALTPWLASMEAAGVLVEQATLTDNGDRSVAAQLVLRARRS